MKKLILIISIAITLTLIISGCSQPKLADFCGEKPANALVEERRVGITERRIGDKYYLNFKSHNGPELTMVEVSAAEYYYYYSCTIPIDCEKNKQHEFDVL